MSATIEQVQELANAIATQAEAIANGTVVGPISAAAKRILDNADTLRDWADDAERDAAEAQVESNASEHYVEVDTAIAGAQAEIAHLNDRISHAIHEAHRLVGDARTNDRRWILPHDEAIARVQAIVNGPIGQAEREHRKAVAITSDLVAGHDALANAQARLDALCKLYTGWSRFYLVTNTNGHIHRSTACSTCFPTTRFAWVTSLSGKAEAEAVAQLGEILCTVCFPSAPVEWTNGTSRASQEAKAERDAAKAERAAKKAAKALIPTDPEGGIKVNEGSRFPDRITTIAAAKSWLTSSAEWRQIYAEENRAPGHHPSYTPQDETRVAQVLSERTGESVGDILSAAEVRAAKRIKATRR